MLGIDHQDGRFRSDKPGADPGVSGGKRWNSAVRRTAPPGSVRLDRTNPRASSIRYVEAAGKGFSPPVCGLHDGAQPGSSRPSDPTLSRARPRKGGYLPAPEVPVTLHQTGHRVAGVCRPESRQPQRSRDQAHSPTRVWRLRPSCVRASGADLGGADLPAAMRRSIANAIPVTSRRGPRSSPSANGANHARKASPAICGSTPCIRATAAESRVCFTSTP